MFNTLTKTVRVSDPERWYGQETVEVKLSVLPEFQKQRDVQILIKSIDDFMMYHRKPCYNDRQVKDMWNRAKTYMYDAMPNEISVEWLLEHGYDTF